MSGEEQLPEIDNPRGVVIDDDNEEGGDNVLEEVINEDLIDEDLNDGETSDEEMENIIRMSDNVVFKMAKESRYNGENFVPWMTEMDMFLQELGFERAGDAFTAAELAPTVSKCPDVKKMTIKAKGAIVRSVTEDKKYVIDTSKGLFDLLKDVKEDFTCEQWIPPC